MTTEPVPRVYLDANVLIYAMETDGERGQLARRWIAQVDRRRIQAVTSELTIAEVLPHPIAKQDEKLADAYGRLLQHRPTLNVIAIDRTILVQAATLRAQVRMELPDAIHVATALKHACTLFLTEDDRLRTPAQLQKVALAELSQLS